MTLRLQLHELTPRLREAVEAAEGKGVRQAGPWGKAVPTRASDGTRFPSRTQARVYERMLLELKPGQRLTLDEALTLGSLLPPVTRKPPKIRIDFVIRELVGSRWEIVRLVDAKPKRWASRDWHRGKLAAEASYGVRIEEMER